MNMFKEIADIKTADMLNLPVPKATYHNVAVKPSEFQQDMVAEIAERAERVRAKEVEPYEDNMLKITNHDSLKISNGKWCWRSRGIGGRYALDCLIKVRGMSFPEAVIQIDGQVAVVPPVSSKVEKPLSLKDCFTR
jgi:hypothetical protein